MKKVVFLFLTLLGILSIAPNLSYAAEADLIKSPQIDFKNNENPKRVEVNFRLSESIDLSQGSSNIIFEFFTKDSNGNLEAINYQKDKSWSGYLNSFENYPSGEKKYSSGSQSGSYPDNIPSTTIYTSTRSNASIDVASLIAVRITVLRADGSGEKVIIYNDGTTSTTEKIEIPVDTEDKSTGIRLESSTAEIPANTVLLASNLKSGTIFETVIEVFKEVKEIKDFVVFEIKLESDGEKVQPDGHVKINIPIPAKFKDSNLAVYRIDNDGTKIPHSVTVNTINEIDYATIETDHFSTYVLAEVLNEEIVDDEEIIDDEEIVNDEEITNEEMIKEESVKDETPKTGTAQTVNYIIAIAILSVIGIAAFSKNTKKNI